MRAICVAMLLVIGASAVAAQSIDDLIALKRTSGTPAISSDGRWVAYAVRETNWTDNAYETEIWLADTRVAGSGRQLTNAAKSSTQPAFSADGKWIAFISDRTDTRQLYRLSLDGGEAEALTSGTEGVTALAWAPDGTRIAYAMTDAVTPAMKERTEKYGEYTHEDHDADHDFAPVQAEESADGRHSASARLRRIDLKALSRTDRRNQRCRTRRSDQGVPGR